MTDNKDSFDKPDAKTFSLIKYPTSIGDMSAYLSKVKDKSKKHPAIIWITGGSAPGGMGSDAWRYVDNKNDQSAKTYRLNGMVMMYPSFRGTFGNPGIQEGYYGEVNDILDALEYLRKTPYIDANQIYLGGHSSGGTLALLAATATDKFKAVFSFGPVSSPHLYDQALHNDSISKENYLRAPINFLKYIKCPTFVIEGARSNNAEELDLLENKNPFISCHKIERANHFNILSSANKLLALKIVSKEKLKVSTKEFQKAHDDLQVSNIEAEELRTLAKYRQWGYKFDKAYTLHYYFYSTSKKVLAKLSKELQRSGYKQHSLKSYKDNNGSPYHWLSVKKLQDLSQMKAIFAIAKKMKTLEAKYDTSYDGWNIPD